MSQKPLHPNTYQKSLPKWSRWDPPYTPPVKIIERYIKSSRKGWGNNSEKLFRSRIYRFYRWLEASKIALQDISFDDLRYYEKCLAKHGAGDYAVYLYTATINPFIRWLSRNAELKASLVDLKLERTYFPFLSEHAKEITQPHANKIHRIYVREFYEWFAKSHSDVSSIVKEDLQDYERHLRAINPPRSVQVRMINMRCVHIHIRWLEKNNSLKRSLVELGIPKGKRQGTLAVELPKNAMKFINFSAAHKRPKTVDGFKTRLKHFYGFLESRQIGVEDFTRLDFEEFAKAMHKNAYAPQTRRHAISAVQIYLSWLYECGLLKKDPEPMIRNFPRPKLPDYLPRNLSPDVDRHLQNWFRKQSNNIAAQALLLMRRTGIRIGDLHALKFDCIRTDESGNSYLKIPIGKLNNERSVPLDKATLLILQRIKEQSLRNYSNQQPEFLVIHPRGRPATKTDYELVLYELEEGFRLDNNLSMGEESLVSHRLRHTFATSLLGAGMTIEGIKELLGHRSLSMSLRYAQVTPQKLRADYLTAMKKIEDNLEIPNIQQKPIDISLPSSINDLLLHLRNNIRDHHPDKKKISSLIRKVERMRKELRDFGL